MTELAQLVLAACFAWAGLSKVARRGDWRASLGAYASPRVARVVALIVPGAELAIAVLLLVDGRAGAAAALVLLTVFTAALIRAHKRVGDRLPCACLGSARERDWRLLVARNACLAIVALVALSGAPQLEHGGLPAVLAAAGLTLAGWTVLATRAAFRR